MLLSPNLLEQIRAVVAEARAVDPEDEALSIDMIEGETEALDLLDRLIMESQEAAAMAEKVAELSQRYSRRAKAFNARSDAARAAIRLILEAMDARKVKRPGATLSLTKGKRPLVIDNPADVPSQLRKPGEPDKTEIRKQLEAGEAVPGCRLGDAGDTLTMRVS